MSDASTAPHITAVCAAPACESWYWRGPEDQGAPVIEAHEAEHGIWEQTRGATPVTVIRDIGGESGRERAGRVVREVWVQDARERGDTKASHLVPWPELNSEDRRIDERIGLVLTADARARDAEAAPGSATSKLVRDRIPEVIEASGSVPVTRIATAEEYPQLLRDKLREEAGEAVGASREQLAGELADVLEVISAMASDAGISPGELEHVRSAKAAERGRFGIGIVWMGNESEPTPPATSDLSGPEAG